MAPFVMFFHYFFHIRLTLCHSGSGRISIILANPDRHPRPADADAYPDTVPNPFQSNVKLNCTVLFPENFNISAVQNIENYDIYI
jgi:hypothetical protein